LSTIKDEKKYKFVHKKAIIKISTPYNKTYQQTAAIEKRLLMERCQQI